tara:strand:- start:855 stop:1808 length:954 start_codon:yes stop_codon:yes gene_type:complete
MKLFIKNTLKKIIIKSLNFFIFKFIINLIIKKNYFVFCYHEVTDDPSEFQKQYDLFVEKKNFEFQIDYICKNFNVPKSKKVKDQNFLITFDDAYEGSFDYGLRICEKNRIKPIFFLNMYSIENKKPLLSSHVLYLKKYSKEFTYFCNENFIKEPSYLNINPEQFKIFIKTYEYDIRDILKYQGPLINIKELEHFLKEDKFFVSNHLYEHYNSKSLSDDQFHELINMNEKKLSNYENHFKAFAFTNGQPSTCFDKKHVKKLRDLNFEFVFSSSNSLYNDNFIFDRIVLTNKDNNEEQINYKIFISYFKKFFYLNKFTI